MKHKQLILIALLNLTSPAQAYKADQEALVVMSDMMAQSVGAELVCDNVKMNDAFFKQMATTLEMDSQDLDTVAKLAIGKQDEVLGAASAAGKEAWCNKTITILTKQTNGLSPLEAK